MENKNSFFDQVLDAQKSAMDQITETTKKFTLNNTVINETLDKGKHFVKEVLDKQKEAFTETQKKAEKMQEDVKKGVDQNQNFFKNWYENQTSFVNNMMNQNQSYFNNNANKNIQDQWQNWMNQSNQYWANMFNADNMKNFQFPNQFGNDYMNAVNKWFGDWQKFMQNPSSLDVFSGMMNTTNSFAKFYELWMPIFKSIQENSYNEKTFEKYFSMEKYTEFMQNFFNFMPKEFKGGMENMQNMFQSNFKNAAEQSLHFYNNMKSNFAGLMPNANFMDMYTQWYNSLENATSPLAKIMTPTKQTEMMQEWKEISNMMIQYQLKNAEMNKLLMTKGAEVMEKISVGIVNKVQAGEEFNSMMKLFQEWLNTSDNVFTELFNTDEYSKLMTEVSSIQLKVKKAIDMQMEKYYFNHLPVPTRTEMDEVYQNIYEMKKQLRKLEKIVSSYEETASAKTNGTKSK